MPITSPLPYFVLAPCLIGVAWGLARFVPQKRDGVHVPLESLRGLLATSVLFSHAVVNYFYFQKGVWSPPPSPFYAFLGSGPVILFFFLSGFLFWSKCLAQDGIHGYGRFLLGRFRRLAPAYYVTVAIVMLIVFAETHFRLVVPLTTFLRELGRWLIFVPARNVNGLQRADLIDAAVIWTLMFEVLFYLLLPLIYVLFKGRRIFLLLAIACAGSFALWRQGIVGFSPALVRAGPTTLFAFAVNSVFGFGFGIGMLVAFLYARAPKRWWQALTRPWLVPIPLLCIAAPILLRFGTYSAAEIWILSIPFIFVVAGNDLLGLLSSRAVFHLGTVSYSFYITHGIVLFVFSHLLDRWAPIRTLTPLEYWSLVAAVGVSAVCFSTLLYLTVERRFMQRASGTPPVLSPDLARPARI